MILHVRERFTEVLERCENLHPDADVLLYVSEFLCRECSWLVEHRLTRADFSNVV